MIGRCGRQAQRQRHVYLSARHRRAGGSAPHRRGPRFHERDLDGCGLRPVHAREGQKVRAVVDNSNIHRHLHLGRVELGGGENGPRTFERQLCVIACDEWQLFLHDVKRNLLAGGYEPSTSGLSAFGGRLPSKSAVALFAAITAIFVRVSTDALAMCGARITSWRDTSAGSTLGSCS